MDLVKALWRGEVSLPKTYWIFGICINVLLLISLSYISRNEQLFSPPPWKLIFWTLFGFSLVYTPFILICIWRSANKYTGTKTWSILAKIMVIVGWMGYIKEMLESALIITGKK
jgi:phosphoglycerol transferase MdoB-like AlkP superfamily enzyme